MKVTRIVFGSLAILLAAHPLSFPTAQNATADFLNGLKNKVLVIRGFYRSDRLHFKQDGQLSEPADGGFGPTDGTVHVSVIVPESGKLVVVGDMPLVYYNADTNTVRYAEGEVSRKIQIDVEDPKDATAVEDAIWSVFFRPGELAASECSEADKTDYQKRQLALLQADKKNKAEPFPAGGICLPLGERILDRVGKDVTVPKPISTPDANFPPDAPKGIFDGKVLLGVVIDATGRPSTILILRGLGTSFDRASVAKVWSWKFEPAKRNGNPVAVCVTIETRFRRY